MNFKKTKPVLSPVLFEYFNKKNLLETQRNTLTNKAPMRRYLHKLHDLQ